jgi:hypothetical protein
MDGDLLRDGVVLGVDLGVDPADKSPGGRDNCLLRSVSFSSGTANNKTVAFYTHSGYCRQWHTHIHHLGGFRYVQPGRICMD